MKCSSKYRITNTKDLKGGKTAAWNCSSKDDHMQEQALAQTKQDCPQLHCI